jgi:hypothetical protein
VVIRVCGLVRLSTFLSIVMFERSRWARAIGPAGDLFARLTAAGELVMVAVDHACRRMEKALG